MIKMPSSGCYNSLPILYTEIIGLAIQKRKVYGDHILQHLCTRFLRIDLRRLILKVISMERLEAQAIKNPACTGSFKEMIIS